MPPEQKLPVLYLLDSIMKNLGGEYLQLFSKNLVATFCHTFEKVVRSCEGTIKVLVMFCVFVCIG